MVTWLLDFIHAHLTISEDLARGILDDHDDIGDIF